MTDSSSVVQISSGDGRSSFINRSFPTSVQEVRTHRMIRQTLRSGLFLTHYSPSTIFRFRESGFPDLSSPYNLHLFSIDQDLYPADRASFYNCIHDRIDRKFRIHHIRCVQEPLIQVHITDMILYRYTQHLCLCRDHCRLVVR